MTVLAFDEASCDALAPVYPEMPAIIPHRLGDHPLLSIDALVELGTRLPESSVEYNRGALPIGGIPPVDGATGLSFARRARDRPHRPPRPPPVSDD